MYGNKCYYSSGDLGYDWNTAAEYCSNMSSELAVLNNEYVQLAVVNNEYEQVTIQLYYYFLSIDKHVCAHRLFFYLELLAKDKSYLLLLHRPSWQAICMEFLKMCGLGSIADILEDHMSGLISHQ